MSWDYRVLRRKEQAGGETSYWYAIHEVFYDADQDLPHSWTENAIQPGGEDMDELEQDLTYMREALSKPVLEVDDDGKLRVLPQP
jgi:hypothetical protein